MSEDIEILGKSIPELRRIIAWYESMGSPLDTIGERAARKVEKDLQTLSMGDRMRADLNGTLDEYLPFLCEGCGESTAGRAYASIGGSIVPFMPAHIYHVGCVPSVREIAAALDKQFRQG